MAWRHVCSCLIEPISKNTCCLTEPILKNTNNEYIILCQPGIFTAWGKNSSESTGAAYLWSNCSNPCSLALHPATVQRWYECSPLRFESKNQFPAMPGLAPASIYNILCVETLVVVNMLSPWLHYVRYLCWKQKVLLTGFFVSNVLWKSPS